MNSTYVNNEWEVSLLEYEVEKKKKYKVVRKLRDHYRAEVQVFELKRDAVKKFDEWIEI